MKKILLTIAALVFAAAIAQAEDAVKVDQETQNKGESTEIRNQERTQERREAREMKREMKETKKEARECKKEMQPEK